MNEAYRGDDIGIIFKRTKSNHHSHKDFIKSQWAKQLPIKIAPKKKTIQIRL